MANNQNVNKVQYGSQVLIDLTFDTVTADKLLSGYTAHDASGAQIMGTYSGGGTEAGTVTQDADGYLVLDDDVPAGPTLITKSITANGTYNASSDSADGYSSVTVNVSGGGGTGLVYESGTYTPTTDVAHPTISFADSHTAAPVFACLADVENTVTETDCAIWWVMVNFNGIFGKGIITTATSSFHYGFTRYAYKTSGAGVSGTNLSGLDGTTNTALSYWVSAGSFSPYMGSDTRYFRSGRTYKWIAVWAPTS